MKFSQGSKGFIIVMAMLGIVAVSTIIIAGSLAYKSHRDNQAKPVVPASKGGDNTVKAPTVLNASPTSTPSAKDNSDKQLDADGKNLDDSLTALDIDSKSIDQGLTDQSIDLSQ